jgi:hypothetical protein
MYPPADPWGVPEDPTPTPPLPPRTTSGAPMYGRASVPVPPVPLREPTAEMPTVLPRSRLGGPSRGRQAPPVSWQRSSRASLRSLADGWGFTATGLLAVFCGWGVWAAAGRGTIAAPLVGLVLVLLVGAGVFVVCRLLGFLLLGRMMGRVRLHARWAHFLTGLFLAVAGVSYLANTSWIVAGVGWIQQQWQRLG